MHRFFSEPRAPAAGGASMDTANDGSVPCVRERFAVDPGTGKWPDGAGLNDG
jgi:hypothetical protein